jgi:hypothetical protein
LSGKVQEIILNATQGGARWVVLSIFVAELIFFHAVLVFWLKLGKRATFF